MIGILLFLLLKVSNMNLIVLIHKIIFYLKYYTYFVKLVRIKKQFLVRKKRKTNFF